MTHSSFSGGILDLPSTELECVCVVTACDTLYGHCTAAMLCSVLVNADHGHFIDAVILDGGLSDLDRAMLSDLEREHPHCRISFIDMSRAFTDIPTRSYFTRSTFYRLALGSILPNRSRALYLDSDMIVLGNACELFDTPLEGKTVAATPDFIMRAYCRLGKSAPDEVGGGTTEAYFANVLSMGNAAQSYFQAGMLLLDLERLRQLDIENKTIGDLSRRLYWYLDQDVLNKHLVGDVTFVSGDWNFVEMERRFVDALLQNHRTIYFDNARTPRIIHFAGPNKPWINALNTFGAFYWNYARRTMWYEASLANYLRSAGTPSVEAQWHDGERQRRQMQ